ncbi:MAG: sigma-54 dependent transcriptional regulator [Alphaproteobacteria bacterium]|uniref:Sigma-54 dependent transcriptional regulator n=1 Tax=Candidatus Nitrobium versatile TaxID=2884831 RepID=A0A953JEA1_9BACT|nr:sigma-54 dependent transcriptional regulator [Candidatus Nitrobium versatile]
MQKRAILVVEDRKSMSDMLVRTLQTQGFDAYAAFSVQEGIALLGRSGIDAVVTDLKLPDGEGMDVLTAARESFPHLPVIVMTAYGSIELAVRAVKEGAYDFITKPFDTDHLLRILTRALEERSMRRECAAIRREGGSCLVVPAMIGVSRIWREVMEKVDKIAPLRTTVLILGESGTGKELIARAIHHRSPRAKEPFIAINCAAIARDLVENEMFGHEKGAYTGAGEIKQGRFEMADKGTIFLDEVGEMELKLQAKLLRVLQESEFERVGGTKTVRVDVRVIAASNKDLERTVSEGTFREDLFYRLNVFPVTIPPLRARREDIIPLAQHFISLFSREMNKEGLSLSSEGERALLEHEWRGNVRELRNVMERAVILCEGDVLTVEHFSFPAAPLQEKAPQDAPLHDVAHYALRSAEKARIESVLVQTRGNKSKAAEILQVSYKTLLTKIKEYGIS